MEVKSPLNSNEDQASMASVVAPPPPASVPSHTEPLPVNNLSNVAGAGVNKRYRPAPAKTFQCRGYGDCRMVFSRSEHLARHIRYSFCPFSPAERVLIPRRHRQKTHWGAPFQLPLWKTLLQARQPSSACSDCSRRQAGRERKDDARPHFPPCQHDSCCENHHHT